MASLTLTELWLHDSTALNNNVHLPLNRMTEANSQVDGAVQKYANGRLREVRKAGDFDSYNISLVMVPQATYEQMQLLSGQPVLMRGPKGRLMYGIYHSLQVSEEHGPLDYIRSIQFRFDEITKTAEV